MKTNDLPAGATTGNFPISPSDPAYRYDTNPNHVVAQTFDWKVPADPAKASSPGCLGLGPIGVSTDGVVFFDALDASGRDAGAHETQDACDGHPQGQGWAGRPESDLGQVRVSCTTKCQWAAVRAGPV